jgi:hypothetical protein
MSNLNPLFQDLSFDPEEASAVKSRPIVVIACMVSSSESWEP